MNSTELMESINAYDKIKNSKESTHREAIIALKNNVFEYRKKLNRTSLIDSPETYKHYTTQIREITGTIKYLETL